MARLYRSNLMAALVVAIDARRAVEASHGYTGDSGFVAGLVEVLAELKAGESLTLMESN